MAYSERATKAKRAGILGGLLLCFICLWIFGNRYLKRSEEGQEPFMNLETSYQSGFVITNADTEIDDEQAVEVNLSEESERYIINAAGSYILTGQLDGELYIDAEEQIVHLILDGVSVRSQEGPAVFIKSAGKVIITLGEGTDNQLRDSGRYPATGEENGCIYSNCDLTINGIGSLEIYGYYKDGIHSKDAVKILGGNIAIYAKRDGIRGNDGILICNENLQIESEGSGLHTTKARKPAYGSIELQAGTYSIISGGYAIHSVGDCYVEECSLYLKGILSSFHVDGISHVGEGCIVNE